MPKRTWDGQTWIYRPDGIQVQGTSFTNYNVVIQKLREHVLLPDALNKTLRNEIQKLIGDGFTGTWQEVHEALVNRIRQNAPTKEQWQGRNGYYEFNPIDVSHKVALRNLIDNSNPAPGHLRGNHQSDPRHQRTGGFECHEYDLTTNREGRAVRLKKDNIYAFYYSTHHGGSTYEYKLITCDDKPVLRGQGIDPINKVNLP